METEIRIEQQADGRWVVVLARPVVDMVYGPYALPEAERVAERLRNLYRSENGSVLARVAQALHDGMLADGLVPSSCIAGAAAVRDLLTADGAEETAGILPVELVAVEVTAFNAPARLLTEAGRYGAAHRAAWEAAGAWSVGLGFGADPQPGRWPGHLVAVVDRRWLVDPTLGQASRPAHGLVVPDVMVAPITERWLRRRDIVSMEYPATGVHLTYRVRSGAPAFTHSKDYTLPARRAQRVQTTLALLDLEDSRVRSA
jgi:hypothetical protein